MSPRSKFDLQQFKRQPAIAKLLAATWQPYSRPMTITKLAATWVSDRGFARLYAELLVAAGLAYHVPAGPLRVRYAVRLELLEKIGPQAKEVCRELPISAGK